MGSQHENNDRRAGICNYGKHGHLLLPYLPLDPVGPGDLLLLSDQVHPDKSEKTKRLNTYKLAIKRQCVPDKMEMTGRVFWNQQMQVNYICIEKIKGLNFSIAPLLLMTPSKSFIHMLDIYVGYTWAPGRPLSPGKPRIPAGPSFPEIPWGPGSPWERKCIPLAKSNFYTAFMSKTVSIAHPYSRKYGNRMWTSFN